ncbi:threonine rich protein [Aspergillus japonicus CBS 114.51]|uniref:Threonine rich protein n=3 Tax=Aspergillus TaxID=5052 RepID=A0A2V5GYE8_ASPV1|nr:threonine rich protein [Aspergillus japonicus CBS 114.51]PYI14234.1 threonine rich protein [Aspergillus violaceofuscus CBS 115571]PYI33088.1 threonine rich protein [Aspergillus indologenus CBS 114.80]RAH79317.1 threonine rich protein [Aspergillus japonicus CBS 114.51]
MRSLSLLLAIVAFAASALALTIVAPKAGDQVDFSKSYKFQWTTVSSDPDEVTLVLVNMASQPTVNKVITQNAKVSDGAYTVDMITGIPVANGYQLNAIANTTQNTGILSQSNQFNVTKVGKVETATASATTATKTAASATASAGAAASAMTLSGPLAVLSALVMSIFAGAL